MADRLDIPAGKGVIVQEVVKGGPADKAGVQGSDKSATIEGVEVPLGEILEQVRRDQDVLLVVAHARSLVMR